VYYEVHFYLTTSQSQLYIEPYGTVI